MPRFQRDGHGADKEVGQIPKESVRKDRCGQAEQGIEQCEKRLAEINEELLDETVAADYEKAQALTEEAEKLNEEILALYERWEALTELD